VKEKREKRGREERKREKTTTKYLKKLKTTRRDKEKPYSLIVVRNIHDCHLNWYLISCN